MHVFCAACRKEIERAAVAEGAGAGGRDGAVSGRPREPRTPDGQAIRPHGVSDGRTLSFESALALEGDPDGHAGLDLANPDLVSVARRALSFHPFYVTEFRVGNEPPVRASDGSVSPARGVCYTEAETGDILHVESGDEGQSVGLCDRYEQKVVVEDLLAKPPRRVDAPLSEDRETLEIPPALSVDECEAEVREIVLEVRDRLARQGGSGRRRRPRRSPVRCKTSTVFVPMLRIEFECAGRTHLRGVLMSSDTVVHDHIAVCYYAYGSRGVCPARAAAVCARCGRPMCRRHIACAEDGEYRCARGCGGSAGAGPGGQGADTDNWRIRGELGP